MTRALVAVSAALMISWVGCFNPRIQNGGFACSTSDPTPCPSGFTCVDNKCVQPNMGGFGEGGVANLTVPKSSTYMGPTIDPGLDTTMDCPDEDLEPNDGPGAPPYGPPILLQPMPDQVTAKVPSLAICPTGNNPATGQHDVDWFKVVLSSSLTIVAEADYDVAHGDLDLALVDATGNVIVSDGTAVSNACVAKSLDAGTYYVVVVGANNTGVNRYDLLVRTFSQSQSCSSGPGDMGTHNHD